MHRPWRPPRQTAAAVKPPPIRVCKFSKRQKLTFGCPWLNIALRGGVAAGFITELVGEASAGKTQACLQLLLNAQIPLRQGGLEGGSIYICTEGNAPMDRLGQLIESRGWEGNPEVLQRIFVKQHVHTGRELLEALQEVAKYLANPQAAHIKLLIVDSIAAVFRDVGDEPGAAQYIQRSRQLFQVSSLLRKLADTHHLVVVVTNQVTDLFDDAAVSVKKAGTTAGLDLITSGREVLPALGLAWSNCINQRLFLARCQQPAPGGGTLRQMRVVFSPFLRQSDVHYVVEQAGMRGLPANALPHDAAELEAQLRAAVAAREADIRDVMAAALAHSDDDYSDYVPEKRPRLEAPASGSSTTITAPASGGSSAAVSGGSTTHSFNLPAGSDATVEVAESVGEGDTAA